MYVYIYLCICTCICIGLDESGNKRLPDVGTWLKEKIRSWWRTRGRDVQVLMLVVKKSSKEEDSVKIRSWWRTRGRDVQALIRNASSKEE